jgi:hypothetical protein
VNVVQLFDEFSSEALTSGEKGKKKYSNKSSVVRFCFDTGTGLAD